MVDKIRDPQMVAFDNVYAALKDLDDAGRKKVLFSVSALLNLEVPSAGSGAFKQPSTEAKTSAITRPVSLVELINDKKPGTNAQRIALFAYYREKTENQARFGREDLKRYFATAKQPPASNFDRDFVEAVRKGWIHEDATDSYLTTKGIEVIEGNFEGERKFKKGNKPRRKGKPNNNRTRPKSRRKTKA